MKLVITGAASLLPAVPASGDDGVHRLATISPPARFAPRRLRRTTRLGRLALAVADGALIDANLEPTPALGLVVGSALADLEETEALLTGVHTRGAALASPLHFQRSVLGAVAGELALLLGLRGWNLTITDGLVTSDAALAAGELAVRAGRCDRCLVVVADTLSAGLLSARSALAPAAAVTEAAAAVVIERADAAAGRGASARPLPPTDLGAARRAPPLPLPELGYCGSAGLIRFVDGLAPR